MKVEKIIPWRFQVVETMEFPTDQAAQITAKQEGNRFQGFGFLSLKSLSDKKTHRFEQ